MCIPASVLRVLPNARSSDTVATVVQAITLATGPSSGAGYCSCDGRVRLRTRLRSRARGRAAVSVRLYDSGGSGCSSTGRASRKALRRPRVPARSAARGPCPIRRPTGQRSRCSRCALREHAMLVQGDESPQRLGCQAWDEDHVGWPVAGEDAMGNEPVGCSLRLHLLLSFAERECFGLGQNVGQQHVVMSPQRIE